MSEDVKENLLNRNDYLISQLNEQILENCDLLAKNDVGIYAVSFDGIEDESIACFLNESQTKKLIEILQKKLSKKG